MERSSSVHHNNLISIYTACGDLIVAHLLFVVIPEPNLGFQDK